MAFSTRYIGEYRTELRLDLKDAAVLWSDDELDRCVQYAVDDLSRFYPLESIYEHTIDYTITGESSTAPAAGTWKDLANKPIKPKSETVTTDPAGTTYTRDTDYTIDYINGRYTIISSGSISEADSLLVGYTKSRLGIDLSAIITNLIRVVRVEYPADEVPQQFVSYNIWNDFMYIGSQKPGESQKQLNDGEHVVIYYDGPHTAPLTATVPSYPAFLDGVICIGASANALLMKTLQYEHQAVTDLASLRTALGNLAAIHILASAALDKVITYLESNSNEDAKYWLTKVTTDAAGLRTAFLSALDSASTYLGSVSSDLTSAASDLTTGAAKINTVNIGTRVPENYGEYSGVRVAIANARTSSALNYIQEAVARLSNLNSYIVQAGEWMRMGETFIGEATNRLAEMDRYLAESSQYATTANTDISLSDRFRSEGLMRRSEFLTILKDKAEYRKRVSSTPVRQPA